MSNIFDCIIVGGGPAGMTAAIYMCRAGYKTAIIMGSDPFGSLGKINLIENYPGFMSINGYDLGNKMYEQLLQFENNDILTKYDFINAINYSRRQLNDQYKAGDYLGITLENNETLIGKSCIFAMGGEHNILNVKNEEKFFGRGISFCATCDGPMFKNKRVAVIGGGNSAMDFAISLSKYCKEVDIIHRRNELRATKFMIDKVKELKNVNIILNTSVCEILGNLKFNGLVIKDNNNHNKIASTYDGCFYALGFKQKQLPEIGTVIIGDKIYPENIFYAGDCIDTKYRQVITACGDGCKAAINCIEYLQFIK
jgi:thioredoxin reductase (NADPH)